jgi:2-haloacid dehalogenase/putative hydrolase of the HAD superfamily
MDFGRFKLVTFDCYGTLIDWETGIASFVRPWLDQLPAPMPTDLVISAFALMQAKHQQVRPTLLYPEVLRRTWRDVEATFGWPENPARATAFGNSVPTWPPFPDTVEALRYLASRYRLAILSNVDNGSLEKTLTLLDVPFAFTITAEDVASYKPGAPHFDRMLATAGELGIPRDQILHTAQSKHHDIAPGREKGLTTVWVNRRHGRPGSGATLATEAVPDLAVTSLAELVTLMKNSLPG